MKELQAAGCESLRAIAAELDARGIPAARGGKWSAVQVSRLLERVNASTAQRISRFLLRAWARVFSDACCARAASGHAAAPPSSVMNSRRII